MTDTTLNKPQVGDLLMDDGGDIGLVTFVEPPVGTSQELYFVLWTSGGLAGYTTAHHRKEIERWTKNVRLQT